MFGGQVGLAGHLKVADGTKIGAQAGIPSDIKKENSVVLGSPAIDVRDFMKSSVVFKKLPEMWKKMGDLERQVETLKKER